MLMTVKNTHLKGSLHQSLVNVRIEESESRIYRKKAVECILK